MDEQERHFIGDLLSNEEDEVVSPFSKPSSRHQSSVPMTTNVAGGPVGCPPTSDLWPEPPPPYTPNPPQWAEMKQPGGAGMRFAGCPYTFHGQQQVPPPMAHPEATFVAHHGNFHPYLSPKMVLTNPHSVPSPNFHPQNPYQIPPGAVYNREFMVQGTQHPQPIPRPIPIIHPSGVPMPPHAPRQMQERCGGQWESVYTPFGSAPRASSQKEESMEFESNRNSRPFDPALGESQGTAAMPKTGKSYRDVVSGKPPIQAGQRLVDSPTLKQKGDQLLQRKHSAGPFGEPRSRRQSSWDGHSESGLSSNRPKAASAAKDMAYGSETYSDSDGDRSTSSVKGEIFVDREKLKGILKKGEGEGLLTAEKNLTKRNVTTNTAAAGTPNEFQKIERRKGRQPAGSGNRAGSPPRIVPVVGQQANSSEGNSRFDILANPKATSNRQASEDQAIRTEQRAFVGAGQGFRGMKLNNEDAVESQYRNKSQTRKTAYINNDLTGDEIEEEFQEDAASGKSRGGGNLRERLKTGRKKRRDDSDRGKRKKKQGTNALCYWMGVVLWTVVGYCRGSARFLVDLVTDIGSQLWDITLHFSRELYTKVWIGLQGTWYRTGDKLRNVLVRFRQRDWRSLRFWRRRKKGTDSWGLEENISLPSTGEEAMRRLLSCRGQDAYSILGLRADCTEDEIKRYYKRQAVLVHPDKNVAYGAEEAFKILHHAWVSIGTSEARQKYNLGNIHRTKAMQELEELMEKLKEKMEEALSTMHCDCGNKHRRFVTKRSVSEARYCRRCKDYHSARENDIWAESHWFGFLWYYYACMDGAVYDITEWAGCPKNLLKHMKPNSHLVQYRLITGKSSGQQSGPGQTRPPSDADIDALFGMLENRRRGAFFDRCQDFGSGSSGSAADLFAPSQSASYRPPSFGGGDSGRPRKAGRRRKK